MMATPTEILTAYIATNPYSDADPFVTVANRLGVTVALVRTVCKDDAVAAYRRAQEENLDRADEDAVRQLAVSAVASASTSWQVRDLASGQTNDRALKSAISRLTTARKKAFWRLVWEDAEIAKVRNEVRASDAKDRAHLAQVAAVVATLPPAVKEKSVSQWDYTRPGNRW